jgi:type I restriction enzyme M protein
MLDNETKRRIDTARDILVGKVPDPKSQVEQITISLIYKFMDDMDAESEELGGKRKFEHYGWKKLMAPGLGGFEVLSLYAEAIQKMNINPNIPQLFRDIFKNAYLPYRDPETLKSFLKTVDEFEYDHSERLGDAFEYLLSVLSSQGDAGQFRTPRHIIDFMVEIIDPKKDETILDPACGTAGYLISSYKHIIKNNSSDYNPDEVDKAFDQKNKTLAELITGGNGKFKGDNLSPDERARLSKNIKGYDISPDMVRLSLVNLYLHGFSNPKISEYDTLTSEDNWNEYADVILANPPFMSPKGGIKPHKRFSVQSKRSEVLFVDYMVEHLTPRGRAAIIVPEGIIFQSGSAYKQLRKMLVENYLFAVVSLPAGVFQPYSGVKTSILLIDKSLNKKTDKMLFVKIESDGFDLGAQRRPNNNSELPYALKQIQNYIKLIHEGKEFDTDGLKNIIEASKQKIAENNDWNLSSERFTEIKNIFSEFTLVKLGEGCDFKRGPFGGTLKKEIFVEDGYCVYEQSHAISGDFSNIRYFITKAKFDEMKGFELKPGELIMSCSGTMGKIAIAPNNLKKGIINQALLKLSPKPCLNKNYLKLILESDKFQSQLTSFTYGSAIKNVTSVNILKQILIPLPALEIQKEIVKEIEGYQKIIDGARQVVENYKPQIVIDPDWPMVELGEVCDKITDGTHRTPTYIETGIPFLRVTDITQNNGDKKFISKEEHEELIKRCKPEKGDILYSKNGTIGIAKLIDWDYEFSIFVSLALLKANKKLLIPKYLEIFLKGTSKN